MDSTEEGRLLSESVIGTTAGMGTTILLASPKTSTAQRKAARDEARRIEALGPKRHVAENLECLKIVDELIASGRAPQSMRKMLDTTRVNLMQLSGKIASSKP